MDYDQYKAEDFIMEESFQQYCAGTNQEADKFWAEWIEKNQDKIAEITKAKKLYFILSGSNSIEDFKTDKAVFIDRLKTEGIITGKGQGKLIEMSVQQERKPVRRVGRLMAAAVILLVVLAGSYFIITKSDTAENIAETKAADTNLTDIAPGGNKAILTLADGSNIILDTTDNGAVSNQGGVTIIKLDGQLAYNETGSNSNEVLYNTITTPNGGQYRLILSDGTRIWLNAASSLTYPTAFKRNERKVAVSGEAYFEVAHDPSQPFSVSVNGVNIEVLGTHFNINAYAEESLLKTTLLEGKVKMTKEYKSVILQPGQQAVSPNDGSKENTIVVNKNIDVDAVVAWKNGLFNFEHSDIDKILREFSRWYDVEVQFEGKKTTKEFFGIVSRNSTLASVLKALKAGGPAHLSYSIVGKKLIVQSAKKN